MNDDLLLLGSRARAARPELGVDDSAFFAHLRRLPPGEIDQRHAGDLLLACACLAGDTAALAALERDFIALVPTYIARTSSDPELVDEVRQRVRQRLLVGDTASPRLLDYAGRGPLGAWIRVMATRIALDLLQQRAGAPDTEELALEQAALGAGPELGLIKTRCRVAVKECFSAAFSALAGADRTLLRYSLLDGLTVNEIAAATRAHRTTVMRQLARVREGLISDVRRRLIERLGVDNAEAEEVVGLVRSGLDLSLSRLLHPAA